MKTDHGFDGSLHDSRFTSHDLTPHDSETIDELRSYDLRIIQHRNGYRFSLDPLLLCDFAAIRDGEMAVDLGSGSGIIPLILARKSQNAQLVGVEVQQELAELALRNVVLNGLGDRITILRRDVTELKGELPSGSFDLVACNPPYRKRGTGRVSPVAGRDNARHESTAGLADFLAAAKYLVRPSGRICFIHHPSRLAEFLHEATTLRLFPARLRMVHSNPGGDATMFLIELRKGWKGALQVLSPLYVYNECANYTLEMSNIYSGA